MRGERMRFGQGGGAFGGRWQGGARWQSGAQRKALGQRDGMSLLRGAQSAGRSVIPGFQRRRLVALHRQVRDRREVLEETLERLEALERKLARLLGRENDAARD